MATFHSFTWLRMPIIDHNSVKCIGASRQSTFFAGLNYNKGIHGKPKNERMRKNVRSTKETCIPFGWARLRDKAQPISIPVSFVLRTFLRILSCLNLPWIPLIIAKARNAHLWHPLRSEWPRAIPSICYIILFSSNTRMHYRADYSC